MQPGYIRTETIVTVGQDNDLAHQLKRPAWQDRTSTAAEWMPPELFEAWQVLLPDLQVPEAIVPALDESNWADDPDVQVTAAIWWPDGSGAGISVAPHEPLAERVAMLADQLQDHEVEALWRAERPAVWPHCPNHPNTHPLHAEVRNGVAVWTCGTELISAIGKLAAGAPVI